MNKQPKAEILWSPCLNVNNRIAIKSNRDQQDKEAVSGDNQETYVSKIVLEEKVI